MQAHNRIIISIKYFSILAQLADRRQEELLLDQGQDLSHVLEQLATKYPAMRPYFPYVQLAVNQNYVSREYCPATNDEIALITPVSGG